MLLQNSAKRYGYYRASFGVDFRLCRAYKSHAYINYVDLVSKLHIFFHFLPLFHTIFMINSFLMILVAFQLFFRRQNGGGKSGKNLFRSTVKYRLLLTDVN